MSSITNSRPTEFDKIMATFNKPYVYQRFPAMLVKARLHPKTMQPEIHDPHDPIWTSGNQVTVHNEEEEKRYLADGYRKTRDEALEAYEKDRWRTAQAAGHREYEDRNLSGPAKAEAAEALAAVDGSEHVPEIPRKRVVRRGRKKT